MYKIFWNIVTIKRKQINKYRNSRNAFFFFKRDNNNVLLVSYLKPFLKKKKKNFIPQIYIERLEVTPNIMQKYH